MKWPLHTFTALLLLTLEICNRVFKCNPCSIFPKLWTLFVSWHGRSYSWNISPQMPESNSILILGQSSSPVEKLNQGCNAPNHGSFVTTSWVLIQGENLNIALTQKHGTQGTTSRKTFLPQANTTFAVLQQKCLSQASNPSYHALDFSPVHNLMSAEEPYQSCFKKLKLK